MSATARLEELATISDEPSQLTRTFLSPALERAKALVARWMREAGLSVLEDAAGNLIGRLRGSEPGVVVCGSHLDTVRNAGKFDGALGVVAAIGAVEILRRDGRPPRCTLDVAAFSDEEGVRFHTTYLGSRFYCGTLSAADRACVDAGGISVESAIRRHRPAFPAPDPVGPIRAYVEAHIEQGPVLERAGVALGIVTAIAGQTRALVTVTGQSGHAGTTPMAMRRDALAGAAEAIALVEKYARATQDLVATVGELRIASPASNVIPGRVEFTVDIRHANNETREEIARKIFAEMESRLAARGLASDVAVRLNAPAAACSPRLTRRLAQIVERRQGTAPRLVSGAGHDAAAFAEVTDTAMLFVRCRGGLSHHPDEFATPADTAAAVEVLADFLSDLP